ncbi:MAG: hypothetical protein ACREFD_11320 [Stellaceae bacterium]
MTPLTNEEFATVQRFCQLMSEKIAAIGLDVFVESNFREYMRLRRDLSPGYIHNPTYDPGHSQLSFQNAFWLRAVEPGGKTVAMGTQRVIDSENFLDELASMRLWHDRAESVEGVVEVEGCESAALLSGRIGHTGGLWIEPDYRRKNLSGLLDHLGRGLMLRNFWFDHVTAVITADLAKTGIAMKQYGWSEIEGRVRFDFFTGGPLTTIGFCHMSRAEFVARMEQWLIYPERNSVQELSEVWKVLAD